VRQAQVQSQFLRTFGDLFPQFKFRGMRRFSDRSCAPYTLALRLAFGSSEREIDLLCVALPTGQPQEVERFIKRIDAAVALDSDVPTIPVLVAPRFPPDSRNLCRQRSVGYIDLRGNMGIDAPGLYIDVEKDKKPTDGERRSPFQGKAERVARRLLLEPDYHWTMRRLSEAADVSLGLASTTTSSLAKDGFVTKSRSGLELYNPGKLLDAWSQHYDLRKSPFRAFRGDMSLDQLYDRLGQRSDLSSQYALTLWSGADVLLGPEFTSPNVALYWVGRPDDLAQELGLKDNGGRLNVFVFQPYDESILWGSNVSREGVQIVHPLQLYLDLGSGDEDELQIAQRVRRRLLPW